MTSRTRIFTILGAISTIFACLESSANSRMGTAEVRNLDGLPCFAIPSSTETRDGISLYTITVSENKSAQAGTLPKEMWHLAVMPYGSFRTITPKDCLRYGEELPGTRQRTSGKLVPGQVYAVHINARPEESNLMGYIARFCVIPGKDGKLSVGLPATSRPDADSSQACGLP